MKKRMEKNGFTLVELLVILSIIAILMGVLIPVLAKIRELVSQLQFRNTFGTEIQARIIPADPQTRIGDRAKIIYEVNNRWGYKEILFIDIINFMGNLDEISYSTDEDTFTTGPDTLSSDLPPWNIWLERFDEVLEEYSMGLKPGAECFLKAKALREKESQKTEQDDSS